MLTDCQKKGTTRALASRAKNEVKTSLVNFQ